MPEGDTIRRAARALEAALAGRTITRLFAREARVLASAERLGIVGRAVVGAEAHGKHLLLRFAGGAALHTHLGLHGRWTIGGPRSHGSTASIVVEAGARVAICHGAPVVELLSARELLRHPALVRLGPDLLADDFEPERARGRLQACGARPVGEALLDQSVLAGIGNVYKSEVLFVCRVSPLAPVSALDAATLDRLVLTARRLMHRNLGGGPRRTTSPLAAARHFVYRRGGQPCRRCGTRIERLVQGSPPRSTYLCPACQPTPGPPAA